MPTTIDQLASLPVFWKLAGRNVLIAGSGAGLLWKMELLAATGAHVHVCCPEPDARARALAVSLETVALKERRWEPCDVIGAAVAIGDFEEETEAAEFAATARSANVPVNVVDRREYCDFEFGALVDRSPLLIAISTDGAAPILAQTLRGRIEALLPDPIRLWAKAAQTWRPVVQARWSDRNRRRRFWEAFASAALTHPERPPTDADRDRLLAEAASLPPGAGSGWLAIVGTGPGDPELLTLRALRALQSAEVIVFERSVPAAVIAMGRREALKIAADEVKRAAGDGRARLGAIAALACTAENTTYLLSGDPRADVGLAAEAET